MLLATAYRSNYMGAIANTPWSRCQTIYHLTIGAFCETPSTYESPSDDSRNIEFETTQEIVDDQVPDIAETCASFF